MAKLIDKRIFWGLVKPKAIRDYMLKPQVSNFSRVISQYTGDEEGKMLCLYTKRSDGTIEETVLGFFTGLFKVEDSLGECMSPDTALRYWLKQDRDHVPKEMRTLDCFLRKPDHITEGPPCRAELIVPEIRRFISEAGSRWLGHYKYSPQDDKDLRHLIRQTIALNAGWSPPPDTEEEDDKATVSPQPPPPGAVAFDFVSSTYEGYLFTIVTYDLRFRHVCIAGNRYIVGRRTYSSLVDPIMSLIRGESEKNKKGKKGRPRLNRQSGLEKEQEQQAKKLKFFP